MQCCRRMCQTSWWWRLRSSWRRWRWWWGRRGRHQQLPLRRRHQLQRLRCTCCDGCRACPKRLLRKCLHRCHRQWLLGRHCDGRVRHPLRTQGNRLCVWSLCLDRSTKYLGSGGCVQGACSGPTVVPVHDNRPCRNAHHPHQRTHANDGARREHTGRRARGDTGRERGRGSCSYRFCVLGLRHWHSEQSLRNNLHTHVDHRSLRLLPNHDPIRRDVHSSGPKDFSSKPQLARR